MDHPISNASSKHATEAKPLTIARVDAIPVALPLVKPIVMAGERIERSASLIVRVEASSGLVGWGEASAAPRMTGDLLIGMCAAVNEFLAPVVIGKDALERAELERRIAAALLHNTGAKCALEMAITDLVGRHLGVSLSDLFGGALRSTRGFGIVGASAQEFASIIRSDTAKYAKVVKDAKIDAAF